MHPVQDHDRKPSGNPIQAEREETGSPDDQEIRKLFPGTPEALEAVWRDTDPRGCAQARRGRYLRDSLTALVEVL